VGRCERHAAGQDAAPTGRTRNGEASGGDVLGAEAGRSGQVTKTRAWVFLLPALLLLGGSTALACGFCVEDKVAAVYDHAVVSRAREAGRVMVFAEVEGAGAAGERVRAVRKAAARVKAIDAASIRVSEAPAMVSFALDPRERSPQLALAAAERGAPGARLLLLKVEP
jgi:hypothetical protein